MGRNSLLKRLTAQVGGDGEMAKKILIQRGHMREDGTLTAEGSARDNMTAEERAKDRAVKLSKGSKVKDYVYNPAKNTVSLRKGGRGG
jgi:plastocyanin